MTQPTTNQPIFLKELSSIKSSYDIANELLLASQIARPHILKGFSDKLWKPDSESIFKSEVEKVIDEYYLSESYNSDFPITIAEKKKLWKSSPIYKELKQKLRLK